MHTLFLGLGSNLGDRKEALYHAIEAISMQIGIVEKASRIIETPAWGKTDLPDYLNQVILVKTKLWPLECIAKLLKIESSLGRERIEKWASRTIDIDILYFNHWFFNTPDLTVPHPFIQDRYFVLEPLNEIAPDFIHPVLRLNSKELLDHLTA